MKKLLLVMAFLAAVPTVTVAGHCASCDSCDSCDNCDCGWCGNCFGRLLAAPVTLGWSLWGCCRCPEDRVCCDKC